MRQTWRWFGPADKIPITDLPQVGVEGIVSALHQFSPGTVWPISEIEKRQLEISSPKGQPTGLAWEVVESLPVSETIKTKGPDYAEHIKAYCQSLRNIAACGIEIVCYNFMPVLDWTRTDLNARMDHGGTAMKFDLIDFAMFDLFILKRPSAKSEFSERIYEAAKRRFASLNEAQKLSLQNNVVAGLPGSNDSWDVEQVRNHLSSYDGFTEDTLRNNLIDFLSQVIPTAEEVGIRMCCHPDDPPFSLLGLPRILSSESDYKQVLDAVDSKSCGATLCTGSLGIESSFDPASFVEHLGHKIHFVHLRNTKRLAPDDGVMTSFYEAAHLEGDIDMVTTVNALLTEESKRKANGRADWQIPMRPDHGQDLLSDLTNETMPGYPLIGRMRGLAELRGIMAAHR